VSCLDRRRVPTFGTTRLGRERDGGGGGLPSSDPLDPVRARPAEWDIHQRSGSTVGDLEAVGVTLRPARNERTALKSCVFAGQVLSGTSWLRCHLVFDPQPDGLAIWGSIGLTGCGMSAIDMASIFTAAS
jgi:hypothetical protein